MKVPLRALAHSRSGDKGNTSNITVIAYESEFYPHIKEQITDAAVRSHYDGVVTGTVTRYDVDKLGVLNFVCEGALGGGVSRSLCLDNYGKSLAAAILTMEVEIPDRLANSIRRGHVTEPA
ncbi:hypothetical protein [Acuticoccus sp. I52.16.1]|uniref:AtuA-related protein n=1 Tax=Acuticoccus sp. I52.16.1 TaxID=2928472 RepID=UPI001FCFD8A6|nr:hypothetical protein [Acuticoccus sp. I52.16.1]UOM33278.1 hypothetical protein MRB58_15585 [Acuticoccus sp. I52.16.1]